jgi:nitrogen fixation/metabolism regulation signal transduction histidine kinase
MVVLATFAHLVVRSLAQSLPAASDHELRSLRALNQLTLFAQDTDVAVSALHENPQSPLERVGTRLAAFSRVREEMLDSGMLTSGAALDDIAIRFESRVRDAMVMPTAENTDRVGDLLKSILSLSAERTRLLEEDLHARILETQQSATRFSWVMVAVAAAGLAMTGGIAYRLGTRVLGPIDLFIESADRIGRGELHSLPNYARDDEFGALARAFGRMAERLEEYRSELSADVLEERRKMSAVLDRLPSPMFFVDDESTVEISNRAGDAFLRAHEISGELPESVRHLIGRVRATGEAYLAERMEDALILHVDFDERFYLPRIFPLPMRKEPGAVAVMLFDVTRMRLAADLRSDLAANLNHEMNTPLTSARLALRVLLDRPGSTLAPTDRELLETVKGEVERLIRTMNHLRELSCDPGKN